MGDSHRARRQLTDPPALLDVTDLVEIRRRIETSAREIETTSRAKDEFLANVSHELRTPLSSIMGWSGLLRDHAHEPAIVRKAAEVILRSAKTQAKLVEDILVIGRRPHEPSRRGVQPDRQPWRS